MIRTTLKLAALATLAAASMASAEVLQPVQFNSDAIKWTDAKTLPAGVKVATLSGDPAKKDFFVALVKFPANYSMPVHSHHINEHDTVLSGTYYMGTGVVADASKAIAMPTGTFAEIPARTEHYGYTKEETIIEVSGIGPWGVVMKQKA